MKTVLVTGGSRGIGRAIVELFSQNGYSVAFTYKKSENEAKSLAEATGAFAIKADSACEDDVLRAVSLVKERFGKIDCLVNNAGVSSFSLFTDLTLDEWSETLNVNLTGAFLYSREASKDMIFRKSGRIINITSVWGLVGASCEVHYSTAKAGLVGMTKALAKELGPSGITVNAIAPGVIETEMNERLGAEVLSELAEESALMRNGTPLEVAKCALFLAGDSADYITGQVINVSGGFVIT